MASGDITNEFDNRIRQPSRQPVAGSKIEIVVANGTSTKEVNVSLNGVLFDLYFSVPAIVTGVSNKAKLEWFDEDDHVIYSTGYLAATAATKYPAHELYRLLMGTTTIKITTDGNVGADETFYVTERRI